MTSVSDLSTFPITAKWPASHPDRLQLYSLPTPNGVKVTVMLEELLALGHSGAEYDAWLIRINEGDQFGSGGWCGCAYIGGQVSQRRVGFMAYAGDNRQMALGNGTNDGSLIKAPQVFQ